MKIGIEGLRFDEAHFSRISQQRKDATFPCWHKGTWLSPDKVPGKVSAFPCCCLGGFLAHGQLSQAILSMSCAVTKSSLSLCLQRLHRALLMPAFKESLLLFLCHLRQWQDPAPEVLSHFAELSFPAHTHTHRQTHRCITTDPGTWNPGKRDRTPGHSLHKWGRGDSSIAHDVLYCGAERGQHCCAMPQNAGDRSQVTAPSGRVQFCKHPNALLLEDCYRRAGDCSAHP